jgi:hypothetical protein
VQERSGGAGSYRSRPRTAPKLAFSPYAHVGGQLTFPRDCSLYFATKKSSFLAFPPFVAATIQRGMRPRPVHVLPALSRYFVATLPRVPLPVALRPNSS